MNVIAPAFKYVRCAIMAKALETTKDGKKHLPIPSGDFIVGCQDLYLNESKLLVRCLYPCKPKPCSGGAKEATVAKKDKWVKWFPEKTYAQGIARFKFGKSIPMADKILTWLTQNPYVPAIEGIVPERSEERYPVIVFSHGLGGFRAMYSSLLTEICSRGFIVMAVEHKDGSAAATFTLNDKGAKEWVFERKLEAEEDEYKMRNRQIDVRINELVQALSLAENLNRGTVRIESFDKNYAPSQEFLLNIMGQIDTENAIASGHSFGGATAVKAILMEAGTSMSKFQYGIMFDSWMFPIQHETDNLLATWKTLKREAGDYVDDVDVGRVATSVRASKEHHPPLFFLNCELFQGVGNLESIRKFEFPLTLDIETNVITLKEASHYAPTDVPLVMLGTRAKRPFEALNRLSGKKSNSSQDDPKSKPMTSEEALEACCDFFIGYLDFVLGPSINTLDATLSKYRTHLIHGSNYKKLQRDSKESSSNEDQIE